jgi:hypothetical protein
MTSGEWEAKFCMEEIKGENSPCNFRMPQMRSADQERKALPVTNDKKGRCRLHGGSSGSGGPPGERNGQYRHGERTKAAMRSGRNSAHCLKCSALVDVSNSILAALPRRSKRAPSGVAQLQGGRGDHHIQRDPPDASSARNSDPDYKHEHERGRRKKDKDLITQAKHRATEYGDNCECEHTTSPPVMSGKHFCFVLPTRSSGATPKLCKN